MKEIFLDYMFFVACLASPILWASDASAADRLVTPREQAERSERSERLSAPSNAREPTEIDADDLRPTLFAPVIRLLEAIQTKQERAIQELELLASSAPKDRTDEILDAVQSINERQVTIKGWNENKEAIQGLTALIEKFRERFERVATVEDVQEAVAALPIPEPVEVPEVDLSGVATQESLLALGDRMPTVANIREITSNVASLSERLDKIAATIEGVDVGEEVETLRGQLRLAILFLAILLGLYAIQAGVVLCRWLASWTKSARAKKEEMAEKLRLLGALLEREKENKSKSAA